ncbi:MAG: hypothetical protein ACK4ND_05665 [Cytophagaceae bacterium]
MRDFIKSTLGILLLLILTSCPKITPEPKPEELPPETQEGKDTFGCLVNGQVWVPRVTVWVGQSRLVSSYHEGRLNLAARRVTDRYGYSENQSLNVLVVKDVFSTGTFVVNSRHKDGRGRFNNLITKCIYETDSIQYDGLVEITKLDTINHIVSGRFHFTANSEDCGKVEVTEGRFDVRYP